MKLRKSTTLDEATIEANHANYTQGEAPNSAIEARLKEWELHHTAIRKYHDQNHQDLSSLRAHLHNQSTLVYDGEEETLEHHLTGSHFYSSSNPASPNPGGHLG